MTPGMYILNSIYVPDGTNFILKGKKYSNFILEAKEL